jgi:hypothetical protein
MLLRNPQDGANIQQTKIDLLTRFDTVIGIAANYDQILTVAVGIPAVYAATFSGLMVLLHAFLH